LKSCSQTANIVVPTPVSGPIDGLLGVQGPCNKKIAEVLEKTSRAEKKRLETRPRFYNLYRRKSERLTSVLAQRRPTGQPVGHDGVRLTANKR